MQLPARLGKYELIEFLGGGMSHVYRAKDTVIGRTVAVKILTPEGCRDTDTKDRFLQEARMAGNISHDNVINIYDFGEDEGRPFLVMEFLQGQDLRTLIKSDQAGDIQQKLKLALQAARAIEYVHSQKIVHRDIKPDNLQVTPKGVVKLMDFGIAKTEDLSRTRPGFVLGTPYYMAPEQVRGGPLTLLVDVYAFGIVLFELMAGVKPFKAETLDQIFGCILNQPLDMTPLKQANVPDAVCDLITRCTAKDPARRPRDFGEICRDLEGMIGAPQPAPPASRQAAADPAQTATRTLSPFDAARAKPKWLVPSLILVSLLVIAALYYAFTKQKAAGPLPATLATSTGEMVLVPAGQFLAGEDKHEVSLSAFYIDKGEVTNAAYAKFCEATGRTLPPEFPRDRPDYPVANITVTTAKEFAKWAGKRLPSMLEWEKAARGTDGRLYPWGNESDPNRANLRDSAGAQDRPWPATQFGGDISPWGAVNMAGNVAELVDQQRPPSASAVKHFASLNPPATAGESWYVVRGGSYHQLLASAIAYELGTVPARVHLPEIGFRCVKDAR